MATATWDGLSVDTAALTGMGFSEQVTHRAATLDRFLQYQRAALYDAADDVDDFVDGIDATLMIGTSATSVTYGTGSQSWTASTGKGWFVGQWVRATHNTSSTSRMYGYVTAYNSGTGALTVAVVTSTGSGAQSSWEIAAI